MSTAKLQNKKEPDAEYRIQFWDVAHAEVILYIQQVHMV